MGISQYDPAAAGRPAGNVGRQVGAKRALKVRQIGSIRFFLDREGRMRDRALFNLAIDSKRIHAGKAIFLGLLHFRLAVRLVARLRPHPDGHVLLHGHKPVVVGVHDGEDFIRRRGGFLGADHPVLIDIEHCVAAAAGLTHHALTVAGCGHHAWTEARAGRRAVTWAEAIADLRESRGPASADAIKAAVPIAKMRLMSIFLMLIDSSCTRCGRGVC
jgi:hypothetical protein